MEMETALKAALLPWTGCGTAVSGVVMSLAESSPGVSRDGPQGLPAQLTSALSGFLSVGTATLTGEGGVARAMHIRMWLLRASLIMTLKSVVDRLRVRWISLVSL